MAGWSALGLTLALLGPGIIAMASKHFTRSRSSLGANAPWLGAFALLVAGVTAIARYGEKLSWREIGFAGTSAWSIPFGLALSMFFIFVFGPAAYWALARMRLGSFESGQRALAALPCAYLCLTILLVAGGEEWLYRGYAIERLQALTDDVYVAAGLCLLTFGIVHLPLWGVGVSLTTLASGGILTGIYVWQRDVALLMLAHVITDLYGLVIAPRRRANSRG